jgi:hypothetical protein
MAYSRPRDALEIRFLANIDHLRIATVMQAKYTCAYSQFKAENMLAAM